MRKRKELLLNGMGFVLVGCLFFFFSSANTTKEKKTHLIEEKSCIFFVHFHLKEYSKELAYFFFSIKIGVYSVYILIYFLVNKAKRLEKYTYIDK